MFWREQRRCDARGGEARDYYLRGRGGYRLRREVTSRKGSYLVVGAELHTFSAIFRQPLLDASNHSVVVILPKTKIILTSLSHQLVLEAMIRLPLRHLSH